MSGKGSVYDWVRQVADGWGMPDGWADSVLGAAKDAHTAAEFVMAIRDTPEYAERFAGNLARKEAGLPMLSETQYLGMEDSYRDALSYYGVESFDKADYAEWIAGNKSVAEITERAKLAGELAINGNPDLWRELKSRGITKGEATDYILNPDKALPKIQKRLDSAAMGAMARDAGLDFGGRVDGKMHHTLEGPAGTSKGYNSSNRFENSLVDKGISQEAAKSAFMAVGAQQDDLDALAAQAGVDGFDDKKLVKNELGIGGKKEAQRGRTLASARRASWSGKTGAAGGAFASSD